MATTTRKNSDATAREKLSPRVSSRDMVSRPKRQREFLVNARQYLKMADLGFFRERRVELVNGKIIEMAPMNDPHWGGLVKVNETLREVFAKPYFVLSQVPIALDEYSEPEPDVLVMETESGRVEELSKGAFEKAVLVVEISDSTLAYDKTTKAELYARFGIAEYWVVNLKARQLEVRREPKNGKYAKVETLTEKQSVAPLATPKKKIKVADLLP